MNNKRKLEEAAIHKNNQSGTPQNKMEQTPGCSSSVVDDACESSLKFGCSEVNIGRGIKWTTMTLPQLQLVCFDADVEDTHLEARKLLSQLL